MSDIVISGYYGLGNSGDEALLESIVSDIRSLAPDVTVTALSGNVNLTKEKYSISTVNRFNPFAVIRELRKAKLLISGGGTLIQDATSTKSLLYYLGIIYLAKKFGLKVMLYANGMGPIKDKNVKKVEKVLNKVDLITLRENESLEEIKRCNINDPRVYVTADPAFKLKAASPERAKELLRGAGVPENAKVISVSVRAWKDNDSAFEQQMANALDIAAENGYFPLFIPMQLSRDLEISKNISCRMKSKSAIMDEEIEVADMLAVIGECTLSCGMRLHMLIFSSVMNVPMVGIAYDPKIKGFMEYMGQKAYVNLENFDGNEFAQLILKCGKEEIEIKKSLYETTSVLKNKANENASLAIELLNS